MQDDKPKVADEEVEGALNRGRPPAEKKGEAEGSGSGAGGGGSPEDFDSDPQGGGGTL